MLLRASEFFLGGFLLVVLSDPWWCDSSIQCVCARVRKRLGNGGEELGGDLREGRASHFLLPWVAIRSSAVDPPRYPSISNRSTRQQISALLCICMVSFHVNGPAQGAIPAIQLKKLPCMV
jgi:hypothetical protein